MTDKILEKKIKMMELKNNKIYALNNIDEDKLDTYSEFPIGSITKIFTVIGLLLLDQEKKIDILNDKIGKYIDNNEIKNLKIIDVINHKSGLKNWYNSPYGKSDKKYLSATEVYNDFKKEKLINMPSGNYAYSNVGYNLLGVMIEKITNMNYSSFCKNMILEPLNMDNTGNGDCNIKLYGNDGKKLNKYQKWERTMASSAGEIKSNINDLIKSSKFPKLLNKNSIKILKNINIFYDDGDKYYIQQGGEISGGSARLTIIYNTKWRVKDIEIILETIAN